MGGLYVVLAAALVILGSFLGLFLWSIRSGQLEDTDTPAKRILLEDLDDSRNR